MYKPFAAALLALATVFTAVPAAAAAAHPGYEQEMNSSWEVLWHQSGVPTRLVRWEQDIRVRIHGVDMAQHRAPTLAALREVAKETGVRVVDVTDQPGQSANVDIEITRNDALQDMQPCVTQVNYTTETRIDSAVMQMRASDARRCALHEFMHVMGLRGHPTAHTVLSYFHDEPEKLTTLDRAMLRAWYSPQARGGMTPFEILPLMTQQLGATQRDPAAAAQQRERFHARTVAEMQAFADGHGDAPAILKRSGKVTEQGLRYGRVEMGYFLGLAYSDGVTVTANPAQGAQWLRRAATMGNRAAQARLSGVKG